MIPDSVLEDLKTEARARGTRRGYMTARDGASECPSWLSGEWAGESITELLGDLLEDVEDDDDRNAIMEAYEDGADTAFVSHFKVSK